MERQKDETVGLRNLNMTIGAGWSHIILRIWVKGPEALAT